MARKTTTSTPKKSASTKSRAARKEAPASTKQGKPVFRAGTWLAVLLLAVLIGGAYYINKNKEASAEAEATATTEPVFIFGTDSTVSSIEVKPSDGEAVKVTRGEDGVWALELPFETEANQGLVEAAASQVTALKIISEIDADPSIFGFDTPAYLITIEFADGKTSKLEIGDATPTNSGYYVRVDGKKMAIVGLSSIDALTNLSFSPPYLNTPTPTALPATPTPESAPEASATPTP
ncbi:MAG: DUF4340 domain-containing protein [Anaerolineales bacterium]|nr:DUF4340 domain-containing protein [Anaerolineales bacterium]